MQGEPILFLDFDGVISSTRAYIAQADQQDHRMRWIDPVATGLLAELGTRHAFQFVISSTWRMFGRNVCAKALGTLSERLHADWCTNDFPDGSRPAEIDDWLARNGEPDFIIVDDDGFPWTGRQMDRWVRCHPNDGFNFAAYCDLRKRLEGVAAMGGRDG